MKIMILFAAIVIFTGCEIPLEFNVNFETSILADGGLGLVCDFACPKIESVCGEGTCWDQCDADPVKASACYLKYIKCAQLVPCLDNKPIPEV